MRRSFVQKVAGVAVMYWSLDQDGDGDYLDDLLRLSDEGRPISLAVDNDGSRVADGLGVLDASLGIPATEPSTETIQRQQRTSLTVSRQSVGSILRPI